MIKADSEAMIQAFGKNEQVKRVFWTLFVAMAGLVLARVVDPVTAQQVVAMITGMGGVSFEIFIELRLFFKFDFYSNVTFILLWTRQSAKNSKINL